MLKNSKPYRANKREYYINLRSNDAVIEENEGNNYKFSWNIKNIDSLSRRAKLGVVGFYDDAAINNVPPVLVIRCPQVQNVSYDSAGSLSTIIFINNALNSLINSEFYPLCTQNLDRIELYVSDEIADARHGIDVGIQFYIQLKVFDYDLEEVDEALMPRYTSQSLSYNPHPMFQM
jgi:hypothetical protein